MTEKEFNLFFTPIVSNAHLHGIDSRETQVGIIGLVKSIKDSGVETIEWFKQGIKSKLSHIKNQSNDFHNDMRVVLDKVLNSLL